MDILPREVETEFRRMFADRSDSAIVHRIESGMTDKTDAEIVRAKFNRLRELQEKTHG